MISDRNTKKEALISFFQGISADMQLENVLKKMGTNLQQYCSKLAEKATIAYKTANDGSIIAIVAGYTHDLPDDLGSYITQVGTLSDYRRRGISGELLLEYVEYARSVGVKYVWLTVDQNNFGAIKSYEKCGFRPELTLTNHITGNTQIRYRKDLVG